MQPTAHDASLVEIWRGRNIFSLRDNLYQLAHTATHVKEQRSNKQLQR